MKLLGKATILLFLSVALLSTGCAKKPLIISESDMSYTFSPGDTLVREGRDNVVLPYQGLTVSYGKWSRMVNEAVKDEINGVS